MALPRASPRCPPITCSHAWTEAIPFSTSCAAQVGWGKPGALPGWQQNQHTDLFLMLATCWISFSCPPRRGGAFCSEANAAAHHGEGHQPHESGEALWGLSQGRMKGEFSLMAGEGHGKVGCPSPHNHLGEGRKLGSFPGHLRNHIPGRKCNPWVLLQDLSFWAR